VINYVLVHKHTLPSLGSRLLSFCSGVGNSGREEDLYPPLYPLKGCRRMNKVEKLCTHENGNKPVETIPGMGGRRIKENDGGGEFQYIARTFVNVTMYPQCNNNMIIIF
jgi:hypothetical protein